MQNTRANRLIAIILPLMLVAVSSVVLGSAGMDIANDEPLLGVTRVEASVDPDWLTTDRLSYLPTGKNEKYTPGFTLKRYHEGALLRADLTTYRVETLYKTKKVADLSLEQGVTKTVKRGELGVLVKTVVETRIGLKLVSRVKLAERKVKEPVDQVVHYGTKPPLKKLSTKSGTYYYRKSFMVTATAYEPSAVSCGIYADGITAIGLKAGPGIIAVDPRVIPLKEQSVRRRLRLRHSRGRWRRDQGQPHRRLLQHRKGSFEFRAQARQDIYTRRCKEVGRGLG